MSLAFQRKIYKVPSTRSASVCHDWGLRPSEIGLHSIIWNILSVWRYVLKQDSLLTGHRQTQKVPKSHVSQKRVAVPGAQNQLLLLVSAFSKGFSQWIHMRRDDLAPPPAWRETRISQHGVPCYCNVRGCGGDLSACWLGAHDPVCLSASPSQIEYHPPGSTLHNVFFTSAMRSVNSALWAWLDISIASLFLTSLPNANFCWVT